MLTLRTSLSWCAIFHSSLSISYFHSFISFSPVMVSSASQNSMANSNMLYVKFHQVATSLWWTAWYSHQGRSQGWVKIVRVSKMQWMVKHRKQVVRQAGTTVSEKDLLLQRRETNLVPQWVRRNCGTRVYNVDYLYILVLLFTWVTIVCDATGQNKRESSPEQ